jgi:hypothetical protein
MRRRLRNAASLHRLWIPQCGTRRIDVLCLDNGVAVAEQRDGHHGEKAELVTAAERDELIRLRRVRNDILSRAVA